MKNLKTIFFVGIVGLITLIPISINKTEQKAEQNINYSIDTYETGRYFLFTDMIVSDVTSSSATLNYTLNYDTSGNDWEVYYRQREVYNNVETPHGSWYQDEDASFGSENKIELDDLDHSVDTYIYELILIKSLEPGGGIGQEIVGVSSNYFIFELENGGDDTEDSGCGWEYILMIFAAMFGMTFAIILIFLLIIYIFYVTFRKNKKISGISGKKKEKNKKNKDNKDNKDNKKNKNDDDDYDTKTKKLSEKLEKLSDDLDKQNPQW